MLRASVVNPRQFYSHEPAPMGIADFGVTGTGPGSSAYEYASPMFQGDAMVNSMSVSISGSTSKVTAFELNAVVVLQRDGTNYTYWIQNGLHLDAASNRYSIGGAYVWNFSRPSATLASGELVGNARSVLVSDTYYFIPSCGASFPGQCTTLSLPAQLTGRIVTSTSSGVPYVLYEYNIGAGWVAYDNVSFAHLVGAADEGFVVSGHYPTPISSGEFYDAEWDWVGAGGGSAAVDQSSDITMSLDFWSGHNFQAVPAAWNFGGDTGETSSNVSESLAGPSTVGPAAVLVSGAGTLRPLYNRTDVGFLNLTIPTSAPATVVIDGTPTTVIGGWTNLTLGVGSHSLYLENYSNASQQFVISAAATTQLDLSGAGRVVVTEGGLPAATVWGLYVNGTEFTTAGRSIEFNLPNGTYPLSYLGVPGYHLNGSHPLALTIPGTLGFSLVFAQTVYPVTFSESGLPSSETWWVVLNGTFVSSTSTDLAAYAPNGSTPFVVGASYTFVASPPGGSIEVAAGLSAPVAIQFSYRPTFIVGTGSPANATVTIGGSTQVLVAGQYNDSVIPGNYTLVASEPGYSSQSIDVVATPGNVTWQNITLSATTTPPPVPTASTNSGGLSLETVILVAVAAAALVAIPIAVLVRRRRLARK